LFKEGREQIASSQWTVSATERLLKSFQTDLHLSKHTVLYRSAVVAALSGNFFYTQGSVHITATHLNTFTYSGNASRDEAQTDSTQRRKEFVGIS
jgi:hypothetical protein